MDSQHHWMAHYQSRSIFNLILPGTHNSGAYTIDPQSFAPFTHTWWLGCLGKRFVITQTRSIYQQLLDGIRSLDLRISLHKNTPWVSHTAKLLPLETVLKDVCRFVLHYPTEIIVIRLKGDWGYEPSTWDSTVSLFQEHCSEFLLPVSERGLTIAEMVSRHYKVILFSDELYNCGLQNCWPTNTWLIERWYDTSSLSILKAKLFNDMTTANTSGKFIMTGPILTPTTSLIKHVYGRMICSCVVVATDDGPVAWSELRDMAKDANDIALEYIRDFRAQIKVTNFNIFQMDFPSDDLISAIISLNTTST
ncbi:hypothetical protein HDV06_006209 [Boothiomyces sp. JEL0866]|nr:hypothetical protein HDV06_006209 [Boothiomyces sp. JEL0866]